MTQKSVLCTGHLELALRDEWGQGDGRSDARLGDVGSIAERRALYLIDCAAQLQGGECRRLDMAGV
jgi:hypothetical protein